VTTDKLAGMAPIVKKISRISASEIWQPYSELPFCIKFCFALVCL